MPPIRGWFRSAKPLSTRQRLPYYEDTYGEKNTDEDLQGIHILADERDTDPEILGREDIRRARNKNKIATYDNSRTNGKLKVMEGTGGEEAVQSEAFDSTTVVPIDDDSDVDELFVSDMRRYALSVIDENKKVENHGDATANSQDQDQVQDTFLEGIERYAQPLEDVEEDKILIDINRRAKQFSALSPLAPRIEYRPDAQQSRNDENTLLSTKVPDDSAVEQTKGLADERLVTPTTEMPDGTEILDRADPAITTKHRSKRVRFESVVRAHSWDASQASNYAYSDDEIKQDNSENQTSDAGIVHNGCRNKNINDVIENDGPSEDEFARRQAYDESETQTEELELGKTGSKTSDDAAEHQSSPQVIDLTSPARSEGSEDEVVFLDSRQSSRLTADQTLGEHDAFTAPKSQVDSGGKRHKRFGMFNSQPFTTDNKPIDSTGNAQPQKKSLRSILKKRRRESNDKKTQTVVRRTKYNLRPRSNSTANSGRDVQGQPASTQDPELELDDEPKTASESRRETRCMAAKKKEKRVIPRQKAARKSAWAAMGLTMNEDRPRKRQTVQVEIPKIDFDRSAYQYVEPSPSQPERRRSAEAGEEWEEDQSSITASKQSRFDNHQDRSAQTEKAREGLVAGKKVNIIDLNSEHEDGSVSKRGRQTLEMVLID